MTYFDEGRGLDPDRARAVEVQVQGGGRCGALSAETSRSWNNTLQYPADGSTTVTEGDGDDLAAGRRRPVARVAGMQRMLGPISLHQAVLGYDQTVSRLGSEILLVNIGRLRHGLPVHFTLATSIAATFDYQTNAAILGTILRPWAERGRERRGKSHLDHRAHPGGAIH